MPHETSKILYVLAKLCYDYKYVQADINYALSGRFLQQSHYALKRNHSHTATLLVQTIFLVTNKHVRKEIVIVFCHNFNTGTHDSSVIWLKV